MNTNKCSQLCQIIIGVIALMRFAAIFDIGNALGTFWVLGAHKWNNNAGGFLFTFTERKCPT